MLRHVNRATIVGRWAENGKAIRKARVRAGLSQERLAVAASTTRRHMIRLENGEHLPSAALRDRLIEITGAERASIAASSDEEEEAALPPDLAQALQVFARYVGVNA